MGTLCLYINDKIYRLQKIYTNMKSILLIDGDLAEERFDEGWTVQDWEVMAHKKQMAQEIMTANLEQKVQVFVNT